MSKKLAVVVVIISILWVFAILIGFFAFAFPRVRVNSYLGKIDPVIEMTEKVEKAGKEVCDIEMPDDLESEEDVKKWSKENKEVEKYLDKTISQVNKEITHLEEINPPPECESLHESMETYLKDSKESLEELKMMVSYFQKLDDCFIELSKLEELNTGSGDDINAIISTTQEMKNILDKNVNTLDSLKSPTQLAAVHNDIKQMFSSLSSAIDDLLFGLQNLNMSKIEAAEQSINDLSKYDKQLNQDYKLFEEYLDEMAEKEDKQVDEINEELDRVRSKYSPFYKYIK